MKEKNKAALAFLCASLLMIQASGDEGVKAEPYINDGSVTVEKTAPEEIVLGETLAVSIVIKNGFGGEMAFELKESFGGQEVVDEGAFMKISSGSVAGISGDENYRAVIKAKNNTMVTVTYVIRPGSVGELRIPGTIVRTPMGQSETNPLLVEVRCNENTVCEPGLTENSVNCPRDCPSDKPDLRCFTSRDSVCDPDCEKGKDPDCIVATSTTKQAASSTTYLVSLCGNKACDSRDENYATCPGDCPSGSWDNLCDRESDKRCDPDCAAGEDVDCSGPGSWAMILVLLIPAALLAFVAYKKGWLRKRQ